jgi:hypothetical protein
MFAAMEAPSVVQLVAFNVASCSRIRHLITDDALLEALDALEHAPGHVVPHKLALAAIELVSAGLPSSRKYDPKRNWNAVMAVAHAVAACLPPGNLHYSSDGRENARLLAVYCQFAAGLAADPDADADADDPYGTNDDVESGLMYLRRTAQQGEAAAQCDLIRALFTRAADRDVAEKVNIQPDRGPPT